MLPAKRSGENGCGGEGAKRGRKRAKKSGGAAQGKERGAVAVAGGFADPNPPRGGGEHCTRGFGKRPMYSLAEEPFVQPMELAKQYIAELANACDMTANFLSDLEAVAGGGCTTIEDVEPYADSDVVLTEEQRVDSKEAASLYRDIQRHERQNAVTNMAWLLGHVCFFNKIQE